MWVFALPSLLPQLVVAGLFAAVLWKAGFRGLWLVTCVAPVVAIPLRFARWFQIGDSGWAGLAAGIFIPTFVSVIPLLILALKRWPMTVHKTLSVNPPSESHP